MVSVCIRWLNLLGKFACGSQVLRTPAGFRRCVLSLVLLDIVSIVSAWANTWKPGLFWLYTKQPDYPSGFLHKFTQHPVRIKHCFRGSWLLAILVLVSLKRGKKNTSLNKLRCSWTALMTFISNLATGLELPEA
jgi:hypothetical protein